VRCRCLADGQIFTLAIWETGRVLCLVWRSARAAREGRAVFKLPPIVLIGSTQ
jgi:hypothetical protein